MRLLYWRLCRSTEDAESNGQQVRTARRPGPLAQDWLGLNEVCGLMITADRGSEVLV